MGYSILSETFVINGVLITVSHLDKTHIVESKEPTEPWNEYVKNNWQGTTGKEHLWELENGAFYYRKYIRLAKRRHRCKPFKYLTDRYIAEWDYDGNHYEVIYGYGIDPQKDVWDSIKNEWNFTEKEKEIIDTWFDMEGKIMSDNFATKKSVWKETVENNNVLFILPGIIALLGFGMLFGWLLTFTPFPILTMNDVRTDFSDSIVLPYLFHLLNGWMYTLVVMAIGGLFYISVICPLKSRQQL